LVEQISQVVQVPLVAHASLVSLMVQVPHVSLVAQVSLVSLIVQVSQESQVSLVAQVSLVGQERRLILKYISSLVTAFSGEVIFIERNLYTINNVV